MSARIESLDWLRGLMAISIMLYHLTYWLISPLDSSGLLGRFGIYGVSVFFVLSGLSMAVVYEKYICDVRSSVLFFVRRLFRIWPLLWLCIALSILPVLLKGGHVDSMQIFLNLTTLFGFVSPGSYINAGAWSIGNEMVYYLITPVVILIYNKKLFYGHMLFAISLLIGYVFAFHLFQTHSTLAEQWALYINPFNNLFLYVAGIAIYYTLRETKLNTYFNLLTGLFALSIFIFLPAEGDQIHIVAGLNRMLFCVATILLVVSFYKFEAYRIVPAHISNILENFGVASYGIYLLHPLVLEYLLPTANRLGFDNKYFMFFAVCVLTVLIALMSYHFFEKRLMAYARNLTQSNNPNLRWSS